jgi:hypothetical protein
MAENLLNYTEVDPNSKLTVTSSKVTANDLDRDEDAYVYKDFGADYFDDIDCDFEIYADDTNDSGANFHVGFSNTVDDRQGWGNDVFSVYFNSTNGSGGWELRLVADTYGTPNAYTASEDTLYYCTLQRAAGSDAVYLYIYSDAPRETLIDTLTVSSVGISTKFRYFFAACSRNTSTASKNFDGYIQNINLHLGPQPSIVGSVFGIPAPAIGLYDTRYKLRAKNRDTALTTRARNL